MTDPVTAAVSLVRAGLFDTYMVYERAGVWTVACGCEATVTLDAGQVRLRHQEVALSRPWESRPLACLGEVLAGLVLRTVFEEHGTRWLCAGASRPSREYEETCEKLRGVAPYLVEK